MKNEKIAILPIKTMIYLCSTHFLKNVIEKVNREMQKQPTDINFEIRKRFIKAFIMLQTCNSLQTFCECLNNIKNVFARKFRDEDYVKSLAALTKDQLEFDIESLIKIEIFEKKQDQTEEKTRQLFFIKNDVVNFYRESPYTDYFESFLENNNNAKILEKNYEKNFYYYLNLFDIIKKQLHIVPFWSGLLLNQYNVKSNRLSNNIVERWFGYFKNKILGLNKRVRNSRLFYLNEIATPLYFFLKERYQNYYEDNFNIIMQGLKKNKFEQTSKASKENYSFKTGKKQSGDYYKPGFSFIKNESEDVIQMINKLKMKDFEHLNSGENSNFLKIFKNMN